MSGVQQTLTVHVPLAIRRRGGRKVIVAPDGSTALPPIARGRRVDAALVKALARAHRWNAMLKSGRSGSISEIAAVEKIDRGYCGRILQLTLLAPDIVEAILDGSQPVGLGLPRLMKPFPVEWNKQRACFGLGCRGGPHKRDSLAALPIKLDRCRSLTMVPPHATA